MKSFFWKFVLCLLPCVVAGWITWDAITKYRLGEAGGFKLGVDLVGGTILVYEIDIRKSQDAEKNFDPVKDINVLAESLKRRIDPNDLFNIVIRPAGGEGRVEIILPTGGTHRTRKAEEAWNELLKTMQTNWKLEKPPEVGRGKVLELADRIQITLSEDVWRNLFKSTEAWDRLIKSAYDIKSPDSWAELDIKGKPHPELLKVKQGDLKGLAATIYTVLVAKDPLIAEKSIDLWVKKQAWNEMLHNVRAKWPELANFKAEMERINPDSVEQLISFIQARGSVIGQAGLSVVEPVTGPQILDGAEGAVPYAEAEQFILDHYGPSLSKIQRQINEITVESGRSKDLTVEEVQRIKDLVAKVGSLEFRILANSKDDEQGEAAAIAAINRRKNELEDLAKKGLPPPPPTREDDPTNTKLAFFKLNLPKGNKSVVSYSWVELGPQERKALHLDNAARNESNRNSTWLDAQKLMNTAGRLNDLGGKPLLQGALFFTRRCEDRNLPDEERRRKEFEYFVLTRDPEIDPLDPTETTRTPKIDGSYLVSAVASPGADLRPAVHFTFNNEGGRLFREITRKNIPSGSGSEETMIRRHLAIILDGQVMSAPTINSEISTQGQISGSFTQKEVDNLVNILRAGRLPATLKQTPVSESTMGPTLGQDTINAGVTAIVLAFLAVMAFMIVYYRFAGLVASIALSANLILTIGFMTSVQATFTLPGLAGIVLMLGMAVDANVLIYERLREERERGATLALAIRQGYERALPTIIDTHLSSIFTAIVLYIVGNDQLKGFGVSLTVGLVISLFTSLFMTRVIFDYWQSKGWLHKLSMLRLFARPDIDFMGIRNVMFVVTVALAVFGIGLFIGRAPLNIDFVGGTAYGGKLTQEISVTQLRGLVDEEHQKKWLLVHDVKEEPGSGGLRFSITYENPDKTISEPRTVNLANSPALDPDKGSDTAAYQTALEAAVKKRQDLVTERASKLPDASVEQVFLGEDLLEGAKKTTAAEVNLSRNFTVRTSEKESELVQAALDRLLRDEKTGKELMKKIGMKVDKISDREARLLFFASNDPAKPDAASPGFVKSLFQRELLKAFGVKDKTMLPKDLPSFDLFGEGKSTPDGHYSVMRIKFETKVPPEHAKRIDKAIANTSTEFTARPAPDRLENFDSALAAETQQRAMWAIIASWGAILVYLWFRFGNWTFGLAAVICLIHDLFITMGVIAACHYLHGTVIGDWLLIEDFKIDLPAVAALLTLVGYSVNDTIVVFDRIREVRGKNPDLTPQIINDSVNQTLSRTVLASLTTWLVVFVLYVWGGPGVHLFAFVMVVGVIIGTYSSIYIASPLLLFLGEGSRSTARTLERRPGTQPETAPV